MPTRGNRPWRGPCGRPVADGVVLGSGGNKPGHAARGVALHAWIRGAFNGVVTQRLDA